ncbi:MAG: ferrochelatase [Myxococcota bacterium]|nr:ferrochelatase [Myxococcota bacterium]
MSQPFDALLLVSFGGPEGPDEVMPFLRNVVRGRKVPDARLEAVAVHYHHFGGVSPLNGACRRLVASLEELLDIPVYWGNRNWSPFTVDAVRAMRDDGVRNAAAFVTSGFCSGPGCRRYRDNIELGRAEAGPDAPAIHKLPLFHDHPLFLRAMTERTAEALQETEGARLLFTAHSIPQALADSSLYEAQLRRAAAHVAATLGQDDWDLVWQSRSGPPNQAWLEPDISEVLSSMSEGSVVVVPLGFISDHMEVIWDLDTEAAAVARERGLHFVRAGSVDDHPLFLQMIAEQVARPEAVSMSCEPVCLGRTD